MFPWPSHFPTCVRVGANVGVRLLASKDLSWFTLLKTTNKSISPASGGLTNTRTGALSYFTPTYVKKNN